MSASFILVGALFGLALGSFLNVVVYRTPLGLSVVRPSSFCPRCKTEIASRDNVPVLGWISLRGKCRTCREPISVRYPLVEAGTAAVFAGLAATVRPLFGVPGWWVLTASLGVAAIIEADGQRVPVAIPLVGGSIGVTALAVGAGVSRHLGPLPWALVGLGGGLFAASAAALYKPLRNRVGSGTVFTLPIFGTCLGWLGSIPTAVGCACATATLIALAAIAVRKNVKPRMFSRFASSGGLPWANAFCMGILAAVLTAAFRS